MVDFTTKEDISVEAFQQRHERALADERKKFSTFLKFPYSTRSRANRRTDSQADSSGANTPDPMSPAPSTPATSAQADQEVISHRIFFSLSLWLQHFFVYLHYDFRLVGTAHASICRCNGQYERCRHFPTTCVTE